MTKKATPMDGKSQSPNQELLALFQEKCPEIFSDGKVDCEKLKATLGEEVEAGKERYGLTWAGKSKCFRTIQEPTTATLIPIRDESVDFDTTKNIFVEGDNLEALKVLQKAYYGNVKMIYIDPPYNTGNDFIYNDDYRMSKVQHREDAGEVDEEGNSNGDSVMVKNTQDSGHYHSRWLNMMYPRLFLARQLLREDGVIFVSIDDNELKNLRAAMDEIFGQEGFVACFPWRKRTAKSDVPFGVSQDYEWIICYAKNNFIAGLEHTRKYHQTDDFPNDGWRLSDLTTQRSADERPNSAFAMKDPKTGKEYPFNPKRVWGVTKDTFSEYYQNGKIVFPEDYEFLNITIPAFRVFESEDKKMAQKKYGVEYAMKNASTALPTTVGMSEDGNKEMVDLFGSKIFSYPKPTTLISHLVRLAVGKDSDGTVLDFFAGSGTTAHAVMALNAEDGGNRQCISVQLPEECGEGSEAAKAGFKTISDITKERIRRAGKKVKEETGKDIDIGFKAFKLQGSNFKIWRSNVTDADELKKQMELFIDNVKDGSVQENILHELMLKTGLDLNTPTEKVETKDGTYFKLKPSEESGTVIIICLEEKLSDKLADQMTKEKPTKFICLDRAFGGNDQLKTNALLQMEQAGVDFSVI